MSGLEAKEIIARRVAREVRPGTLVNLGIGLPSLVACLLAEAITRFRARPAKA